MCKLLIGVKANNSQLNKFAKTIEIQRNLLEKEPHGIGALIIDYNNKVSVCRELNNYEKVFMWVKKNMAKAKIVSIHTRQATDGDIDEKNVHFFKQDGYYFAHNGIVMTWSSWNKREDGSVSGYYPYPAGQTFKVFDDDMNPIVSEDPKEVDKALEIEEPKKSSMSDSYRFLESLKKPISKNELFEQIGKSSFTGVGFLVSENAKKAFTFSTRNFQAHSDFKSYVVSYSFEPNNVIVNTKKVFGFEFLMKDKSKNEKLTSYVIPSGIYELDIRKLKVGNTK